MLVASGRETRLHLRREGERRLADAAAAQAPLALSSRSFSECSSIPA